MEKKVKQVILNRGQNILRVIIILSPMLVGMLFWDKLPDRIATHFGTNGVPNGWSNKGFAVFGLPLVLLVIQIMCSAATLADPKREKINEKMMGIVLWIVPLTSLVCGLAVYGYALNLPINAEKLVILFVGILFLVMGNYLPKCRQNYTMGIKIPWTLSDENNWNHTHRFAGWVFVLAGIAVIITGITGIIPAITILPIILIAAFLPMIYSFIYYLRHQV